MKKIILLASFLTISTICFAQADSTKIAPHEQYCMIIATGKLLAQRLLSKLILARKESFGTLPIR